MMTFCTLRCRMCRNVLIERNQLIITEMKDCLSETQFFVDESEAPPWIQQAIVQGQYIKGKLNCPLCHGRVGAFDFVSHIPCRCGQHSIPHVRILSDRVDKITSGENVSPAKPKTFSRKLEKEEASKSQSLHTREVRQNRQVSHSVDPQNDSRNEDNSTENIDNILSDSFLHNERTSEDDSHSISGDISNGVSTVSNVFSVTGDDSSGRINVTGETNESSTSVEIGISKDSITTAEGDASYSSDPYTVAKDHLICPICLELFYLPHQVHPCLHIYCDPCLRQLNGNSVHGQLIKCPMCRVKVKSCTPHKEYTTTIKYYFPEEHNLRKKIEKKQRQKQHPLPGSQVPAGARRQRGRRGANQQLSVFAGVCFVVMLIFLGFTIFAITIGFVSWYLLEVAMDLVVDVAVELQTLCDLLRSAIILFCIDGSLKEEYIHALFNSSTRLLMAFAKVVGTQENTGNNVDENIKTLKDHMAERTDQILTKMTQAAIANYVVVGAIVTYALYRFARYLQQVRADR